MPCASQLQPGQTLEARGRQIDAALARLERALAAGADTDGRAVKVVIGPSGALVFAGWVNRDGVSDVCAARALTAQGSSALRMAIARAEAVGGRKYNPRATAAGVHSHDGGRTWSKH